MKQIIIIKNFTPHEITLVGENGETLKTFQPEGLIRLKTETVSAGEIAGVPVSRTIFGQPEGLPEYQKGTYYIVSQLVKSALPERKDLLVPAEMVRDEQGHIIGCKSLGI